MFICRSAAIGHDMKRSGILAGPVDASANRSILSQNRLVLSSRADDGGGVDPVEYPGNTPHLGLFAPVLGVK